MASFATCLAELPAAIAGSSIGGHYTAFARSRQTRRFDTTAGVGYIGRMTAFESPSSAAAPAERRTRRPAPATLVGVVLVFFFAALYLFTLDDGLRPGELEGGDLITHQYAQAQGRPSNAPGYPLYTMGGWLWFHLGRLILGRDHIPIPILSSYSTLWALVALWLLYRLLLEVTRGQGQPHDNVGGAAQQLSENENGCWPVAAAVTVFYGLTYFFWYYAVTTEQYTSAVAWTLAVVLLAFRWERERRDGYLLALATLMGVALAHMVTLLFIAPPLLWFVLRTEPKVLRRPRFLVGVVVLALLPLLSYSYVYVRGAQHPEWRGVGDWASTGQWFLSFISTRQGRDELTWTLRPFLTPEFPALIWRELTWPGLTAGIVGLATIGRRRAIMLYATLAIYLIFCWIDRLGNWYQVIMPVYALLAVGLGAGAGWLWRRIGERSAAGRGVRLARGALILGLAGLALYRGAVSYPRADSSHRAEDTGLQPGWAILADDPLEGTAVFGALGETLALNYLTEIWGARPDVRSVTSAQAQKLLAEGAPLVVTEAALPLVPAEVSPSAHYSALGRTLVALSAESSWQLAHSGATALGELRPWLHDFGGELQLQAGRLGVDRATGETVALLIWQAASPPSHDWSVSVRLLQGGQEIAQLDRVHPVSGAYPTSGWASGELVADAYPFTLPPGVSPDGIKIVVYRQLADGSFANLDVAQFPAP